MLRAWKCAVAGLLVTASIAVFSGHSAAAGVDPLATAALQARTALGDVIHATDVVTAAATAADSADALAARLAVIDATAGAVDAALEMGADAPSSTQAGVDALAASSAALQDEHRLTAQQRSLLGTTSFDLTVARRGAADATAVYTADLGEVAALVGARTHTDPARLVAAWLATSNVRAWALLSALSNVGDPYRTNAVGPDRFDCSGLTTWSWAQAGVALPHQSGSQQRLATPTTLEQAHVGDLVFTRAGNGKPRYPVRHVEMLLGVDNLTVGSPAPGQFVRVTNRPPRIDAVGTVAEPAAWHP